MRILVACEESQAVTIEMRKLGHEAYSCDIIDCSGGHPEWHIKQDVLPLLNGYCEFKTSDGIIHRIDSQWDMIIAHPPCTYLTVTGNRWFNVERYGEKAIQRAKDREEAIAFFMAIAIARCDKIAIENPVGVMSTVWRKPNQIIHPWEYGDSYEKSTCLWLKGLPNLVPTNIVHRGEFKEWVDKKTGKIKRQPLWFYEALINTKTPEERAKVRSKTFPGIAKAMAEQWAGKN